MRFGKFASASAVVFSEYSEILRFRTNLSYIPSK